MSHETGALTSDLTINLVNHMAGLVFVRKSGNISVSFQVDQSSKKKNCKKKKNITLCLFDSSDKFIL